MAVEAASAERIVTLTGLAQGGFDFDRPLAGGETLRVRLQKHPRRQRLTPDALSRLFEFAGAKTSPHVIEPSRSSKTKCTHCKAAIKRGTPQFGFGTQTHFGIKRRYYHLECAQKIMPAEVSSASTAPG